MNHWTGALTFIMGGGLTGFVGLIIRARSEKANTDANTSKTDADAAAVVSSTALTLLGPLREEYEAAHAELVALRREISHLRQELGQYHEKYGPLPTV